MEVPATNFVKGTNGIDEKIQDRKNPPVGMQPVFICECQNHRQNKAKERP
jgi:hypothetical protein